MELKKWQLILIFALIGILILGLAILVQNTKDTNDFTKWMFTFLDEWATVLGATVTLMLAGAAFLAIKDNRDTRKKEKQERLLKEILHWATDIGRYMLDRYLPPFENHCTKEGYLDEALDDDVIKKYTDFRMFSVYIIEISKGMKIWGLVNDAVDHLRAKLRLLHTYNRQYNKICNNSAELKVARNIARNEDRLYNSVVEIIQYIGNINSLD